MCLIIFQSLLLKMDAYRPTIVIDATPIGSIENTIGRIPVSIYLAKATIDMTSIDNTNIFIVMMYSLSVLINALAIKYDKTGINKA